MKYMGSKRAMLKNGLGHLIDHEIKQATRFVDLFTGSGAVAMFAAQKHVLPVIAVDLQSYSAILAGAVINRALAIDVEMTWKAWATRAQRHFASIRLPREESITQTVVEKYRAWSAKREDLPITQAYGGHYFSPRQAIWLDVLRSTLPRTEPVRTRQWPLRPGSGSPSSSRRT